VQRVGKVVAPQPVKLFVGFITNDLAILKKAERELMRKFGPVQSESPLFEFNFTSYYTGEFGNNLKRKFICFKRTRSPENAQSIKIQTNRLEEKFSRVGKRRINIDPGYLTLSKVILLTTKDYSHRIHLGKGMYAEVALSYKQKTFRPFAWTYPDYASRGYIDFFNRVRDGLLNELRRPPC